MFGLSRVMVIGWLTLALSILAVPQITALVPEGWLGYVAATAGVLTLLVRFLSGALGANPLTVVGILTLLAGLLGIPDLVALIPLVYMPYVTAVAAVCTLLARVQAGTNPNDKTAAPVGAMFLKEV